MEYRIISHTESRRLILIFAGWAMDWRPMKNLRRPGYDVAVVWGYAPDDVVPDFAEGYDEICLVAWSLGVAVAPAAVRGIADKITLAIAVNGTLTPVDDRFGIPEAIFRGTLDGLDDRNLTKFYRRVTGSRPAFDRFDADRPVFDLDTLRRQLAMFLSYSAAAMNWDMAIIGKRDAIFPPENMHRAWAGRTRCVDTDDAHMPDFQDIIDCYVINKELVQERFSNGLRTYDSAATVQADMAARMMCMLADAGVSLASARVLEVGSGTGLLSRLLDSQIGPGGCLDMIDLAAGAPVEGADRSFTRGDAELIIRALPSAAYDLVISASTVQWFHSPERFMAECRRVLRPGGCIAIGTYVDGNLPEVRSLTGAGLSLLSADDWHRIAAAQGGDVAQFTPYSSTLHFGSALEAFRHLKLTGVNSLATTGEGAGKLRHALRSAEPFELTYKALIFLIKLPIDYAR